MPGARVSWYLSCQGAGGARYFQDHISALSVGTLGKKSLDELLLFSDLEACVNKYLLELWQSEWDEFPHNKLHKIFPKLNCISCPENNRKELSATHWYLIHSFLPKALEAPVCITCDELLTLNSFYCFVPLY